ncbi:hypothetical protein PG997_013475 [Apiospora hydei]|uniref:Uncharacterized protein n=1 Tax=Apiospora hydei TaxID=1337664 RepID=A0ABR1V6B0_9PEZI
MCSSSKGSVPPADNSRRGMRGKGSEGITLAKYAKQDNAILIKERGDVFGIVEEAKIMVEMGCAALGVRKTNKCQGRHAGGQARKKKSLRGGFDQRGGRSCLFQPQYVLVDAAAERDVQLGIYIIQAILFW